MGSAPKKSKADPVPKKLAEFLPVPNEKRMNPQSIRHMIFEYIVRCHGRDCDAAARELELRRFQHKKRKYKSGITKNSLYKITRDEHQIRYLLLEAIAIERKVPVSLLLFYTRLCADQTEADSEIKLNNLIRGLTFALQDAEVKVKRGKLINFDDLAHWVDAFVALTPQPKISEEGPAVTIPEDAEQTSGTESEPTLTGLDLPIQKAPERVLPSVPNVRLDQSG
jgi:hypothetical protein